MALIVRSITRILVVAYTNLEQLVDIVSYIVVDELGVEGTEIGIVDILED